MNTEKTFDASLSETIFSAVKDNNIPEVERLLGLGANPNAIDDMRNGESLLCLAHNIGMMEVLLAHGADVNYQDYRGDTPLHWNVSSSHEVVVFLLQHGADPHLKNGAGDRAQDMMSFVNSLFPTKAAGLRAQDGMYVDDAVDFVALKSSLEKEALMERASLTVPELPSLQKPRLGASDNALHTAMRNGDLDEAKRLIEEDGDLLDAVNHENKRPLQVADVHAVDKDGNTALHYAAAAGTKSDVMDLVQRGADLDAQNHLGNDPIYWAQLVENNNTLDALDDLVQRSRGISLS
ncbi:MAG: ankyrin repeat domain-containing protein [Gallionella sp.]